MSKDTKKEGMETQKGWRERFKEGCNTDNISDPPSDIRWIIDFIASVEQDAYKRAAEVARGESLILHPNKVLSDEVINDATIYNRACAKIASAIEALSSDKE